MIQTPPQTAVSSPSHWNGTISFWSTLCYPTHRRYAVYLCACL